MTDATRGHLGDAMRFLGPIVAFGGVVGMLRTGTFSWTFLALVPIGLVAWWVGRRWATPTDRPS